MTLEQLRIFLAVAEREHVTRAAEALNLTQSTVSSAIHALEQRHSVQLFHRVGRRIELTAEGKVLLEQAKGILSMVRTTEMSLAEMRGTYRGTLTVFASQTISGYWLPGLLVRFQDLYPDVDLRLDIGNTAQCARAVLNGSADLGLIEGAIDEPTLLVEVVDKDRVVLVVGVDHPWAEAPPVLPRDLLNTAWALREPGSGTRSTFEKALHDLGIPISQLRVRMELPSNEAVCAAVAASNLATVVSQVVAKAGIDAGTLVPSRFDLPSRNFSLIRHKERRSSRIGSAFQELIKLNRQDHKGS